MSDFTDNASSLNRPAEPLVLGEDLSRRTRYAKEFRRSDGSHLLVLYPDPIHFEKDGNWEEIDNRLTEDKDEEGNAVLVNAAGEMSVRLPQDFEPGKFISLTHQGYELKYHLTGELAPCTAYATQRSRMMPQARQFDSSVLFQEVFPQTDISYTLHADELKEAIILKDVPETAPVYTFAVDAPGLSALLQEDGSVFFRPQDDPTHEPVFVFPAPFLVDANGDRSDQVVVSVESCDQRVLLCYAPDADWLKGEERAYPVILDPVVRPSLNINNIQDQQVDSNKNDVSYTSSGIECGRHGTYGIERFYMRYNDLPALAAADVIIGASISIERTYNSSLTTQVNVHKVKNSWQVSSLQWSNRPAYNTRVEDYQLVKDAGWYTWNVTDIAREWYAENKNYGMMFKTLDAVENATTVNNKTFCSSDNYVGRPPGATDRLSQRLRAGGVLGLSYPGGGPRRSGPYQRLHRQPGLHPPGHGLWRQPCARIRPACL